MHFLINLKLFINPIIYNIIVFLYLCLPLGYDGLAVLDIVAVIFVFCHGSGFKGWGSVCFVFKWQISKVLVKIAYEHAVLYDSEFLIFRFGMLLCLLSRNTSRCLQHIIAASH